MEASNQTILRQRVVSCSGAFQAVDEARKILAQLELYVSETVKGDLPNAEDVARTVHKLRNQADKILVGLFEARVIESQD